MKLSSIETPTCKFDGGAIFGVVPKSLWAKFVNPDENNLVESSMRCLLIEEQDRKILIDTGVGTKLSDKLKQNFHLANTPSLAELLIQKGVQPSEITDVVFTHLHFDHVGGAVVYNSQQELEPLFPNAKHWVSKQQWENALHSNIREKASYYPENYMRLQDANLLHFIEENTQIYPFLELRLSFGHTAGNIIPLVKYHDKTLVYMGDFIPTIYNLPIAYVTSYDTLPLDSMNDKDIFLKEALQNNYILFFEHDSHNECATVMETPKGIRVKETFLLSSIT